MNAALQKLINQVMELVAALLEMKARAETAEAKLQSAEERAAFWKSEAERLRTEMRP